MRKDILEALVNSMTIGLIMTDTGNNIAMVNPKAEKLLEISRSEITGKNVDAAVSCFPQISFLLSKKHAGVVRWKVMIEGSLENIYLASFAVKGVDAEILGEVRLIWSAAGNTDDEKLKDEFLSSISHEFRTPLTSILSFSEILLNFGDEGDWETRKEFLEIIHKESIRMSLLIDDFMYLTELETGKVKWKMEKGCLKEAIQKGIEDSAGESEEDKRDVRIQMEEDIPSVLMDSNRISHVLKDLVSNAKKFSDPDKEIQVHVEKKSPFIQIGVRDHGMGLSLENRERIFEKFIQVGGDSLTDKPKGTGLGLTICREIIHKHHGIMWVESEHGKGSTFYFTLPLKSSFHRK